jgi:chromosome segregation protein
MLTALELAGFKSFADKTRFDFPDGITVIVGPNGSGKSNVVDAIKWVLGAQSAKSLRGADMIDVIFKGSSSNGRKPGNSAEATLVFDNSGKHLPIDANEVHVTRRVFRSGEGEYLINGQACRLKDIKDLFRGTGVGVDAYSLIEQGKVDRMLQASPKDRRVIFEEAAGISRFKSKKTEALRRLQRVEQNLVRLKDIVDEVRGRLNALKSQANKAQRYREMTQRLQELRLQLGWTEYVELEEKSQATEAELVEFQTELEARQSELTTAQENAQKAEFALHRVAEDCQRVESDLQEALQRIAVGKNQQTSLHQRTDETTAERLRQQTRLVSLRMRAGTLQSEVDAVSLQVTEAQQAAYEAKRRVEHATLQSNQLRAELEARAQRHDTLRRSHVALLHQASSKAAEAAQQENVLAELVQQITAAEVALRTNQNSEQSARKTAELAAARLKQIHDEAKAASENRTAARTKLDDYRTQLSTKQEEAAGLLGRLEGAAERLQILDQLQQHLDGVDAGARQLVEIVRQRTDPAFKTVLGLVAELLEVDASLAPMIDTALGQSSHALVLTDGQLVQLIRGGEIDVKGRLSLIRLDRLAARRFGEKIQLDGVRGVIGRADRLVRCSETTTPLFRHLLGTTWLVDTLDTALDLGHFRGAGLRFVTADCQLIDADGTLTLGSMQASVGLVSRRSEIQTARQEIEQLKLQYQQSQGEIERLQGRISKLIPTLDELELQSKSLAEELAHQQASAQTAVGKLDAIEADASRLTQLLTGLLARRVAVEPSIIVLKLAVDQLHQQINTAEVELSEHEAIRREFDSQLTLATEELTTSRIACARMEQRLEALQAVFDQCTRNQTERLAAVAEACDEVARLSVRVQSTELQILELTSQLAVDFHHSEAKEAALDELAARAAVLRSERTAAHKRLDQVTRAIDKLSQRVQTTDGELQRAREAIATLVTRMLEDYQIGLEQLSQANRISNGEERAALQTESSKLRQDIASVGEVNLTALNELDELQSRYDYLNNQYEDVQAAKESLNRIIHKINADSRKLFLETLEIIRQNFQKLYRKSFGGGNADIVLEDVDDVLECGIDIIATPPGKTALSNSLLSGGEKALTAVALLLAIFQYRPSPFCVLDEVDAPFDEANIGRFVNVLTEFLDWTKFIVVTHSKKTMTAANTLYGVTMQESGISKQVAVRFENVRDNGEIIEDEDEGKFPRRHAA